MIDVLKRKFDKEHLTCETITFDHQASNFAVPNLNSPANKQMVLVPLNMVPKDMLKTSKIVKVLNKNQPVCKFIPETREKKGKKDDFFIGNDENTR